MRGTSQLLRTLVKHDGRRFAPWLLIVTVLSVSSVIAYPLVFPSQTDRAAFAATVGSNPALGLIFGPAFDLSTTDGFNAWRSLALGGFLTALCVIFAVIRTTRAQEDSGQAELLASGVMGRQARLSAAVGLALLGSVAIGCLSGIVTALCGGDWQVSLLLGATFAATGWMFTGVAAVAAQLGTDSRSANSLAVGFLGVLFVLRGFAYSVDAQEWTIWINPLGWMTQTRPAFENDWWPLLYALAFTVLALVVAYALQTQRDFGQGAIPPRPGPTRGKVRTTWRLAIRLNRGPVVTWAIAFVILGVVFGYFATSVQDLLSEDASVAHILASGAASSEELVSAFIVTILSMVGILAAVSGVQVVMKVRSEEIEDRVEPIIAGSVRRSRYFASNVLLAALSTAVNILIAGTIIAWLASSADIGVQFSDVLVQAIATIPASWTVVGVSVAVIGARPAVALAAWVGVVISFALTILGPTFRLWDWILGISPFWHVPNVTGADVDWTGLAWISLFTVGFIVVGRQGFRNRDLAR